ncbi:replication initiator [Streptomyces sp. NPDC059605]
MNQVRHQEDYAVLGTALDPGTYDYAGAVLFNNLAGALWRPPSPPCRPR